MRRVHPQHLLGFFRRLDIQVDRDGFTIAAAQDALEDFRRARVDFLVRDVRRDVDEVAGAASAVNSRCSPQRMRARPFTT
jgi:hypothetical protein